MKYKFIPVSNDLVKAEAFANTLNNTFITRNQKITQPSYYIETIDAVRLLQKEGWELNGVAEDRNSSRKIVSNYAQLYHPDFNITDHKGKTEALASITISNSCNGKQPLNLDLGAFRLVCSNGMIRKDTLNVSKIKHTEINYNNLQTYISNISRKANTLSDEISKLKGRNMSPREMSAFAIAAARLKFQDISKVNIEELLKVNRTEDMGTDVWTVFNRLQESLTHNVVSFKDDIKLNKELFSLAEAYA